MPPLHVVFLEMLFHYAVQCMRIHLHVLSDTLLLHTYILLIIFKYSWSVLVPYKK